MNEYIMKQHLNLGGTGIGSAVMTRDMIGLSELYGIDLLWGRLSKQVPSKKYGGSATHTKSLGIGEEIKFSDKASELATDLEKRLSDADMSQIDKIMWKRNPVTGGRKKVRIQFKLGPYDWRPKIMLTPRNLKVMARIADFNTISTTSHYSGVSNEEMHEFASSVISHPEVTEILAGIENTMDKWYHDNVKSDSFPAECKLIPDMQYYANIDVECEKDFRGEWRYAIKNDQESYMGGGTSHYENKPRTMGFYNNVDYLKNKLDEGDWDVEWLTFGDLDRKYGFAFRCRGDTKGDAHCEFHANMTKDDFLDAFPIGFEEELKYPSGYDDRDRHAIFKIKPDKLDEALDILTSMH